jgi:hypothetical protein
VFPQNPKDLLRLEKYLACPDSEPAMLIHGVDPVVHELPLGAVLLRVLAFHL